MSLRRGDLVTLAFKGPYTGKPRPALVVQADDMVELASVVVCPLTGDFIAGARMRLRVEPNQDNNLRAVSHIMVDKLSAVPRQAVSAAFGHVTEAELARVDLALRLLLAV
jgi:mRNA interferase MazF